MATTLTIVTSVENDKWKLEMSLNEAADIPRDIFLYENTGAGLGEYQTICSFQDYAKFQKHEANVNVPVFGNKYLKHTVGILYAPLDYNLTTLRAKLTKDVKDFKAAYMTSTSSVTVAIP